MRAWVFNIFAGLWLLLLTFAGMAWLRSYWVGDGPRRDSYGTTSSYVYHRTVSVQSAMGGLSLVLSELTNSDPKVRRAGTAVVPFGTAWSWPVDPSPHYPNNAYLGARPKWSWWRGSPPAGFGLAALPYRGSGFYGARGAQVVAPFWLAIGVLLLPMLALLLHGWRQRLRDSRVGLCRACGYNLTGNVSGVCPECGTHLIASAK